MNSQLGPGLMIDVGSDTTKAGRIGDTEPSVVFPTMNDIGDQSSLQYKNLTTVRPMQRGLVTNWGSLEKVLHFTFSNMLGVSSDEHPVFLTENFANPKINREKISQILFETFNVPAMYLNSGTTLSLFSAGKTTGLVLDSGHGVTAAVPIYEGYPSTFAFSVLPLAGTDLTDYMIKLLAERNISLEAPHFSKIAQDLKEKVCYVADNADMVDHCINIKEKSYQLPDGNTISVGAECFKCPEALFHPTMLGLESEGIQYLISHSIMKLDMCIRYDFYENVHLFGGTSLLEGLADRVQHEVVLLSSPKYRVKVFSPDPNRKYSAWVGGSLSASLDSFHSSWFTSQEYDEWGPSLIHRKCL